jgi:phage shock protein C
MWMDDGYKRLYRSADEARLAGVCAGLGDYQKVDPVVLRLIWVGVTCLTGIVPGVLAYVIAWAIVPPRPVVTRATPAARPAPEPTA